MSVQRGDVVLFQTDFVGSPRTKVRPMLVVQNDANNRRMSNTILVGITTNLSRSSNATQVLIDVSKSEAQQCGLTRTSVVSCENIFTVNQSAILCTIGHFPDSLLQQVDDALKASLGLM